MMLDDFEQLKGSVLIAAACLLSPALRAQDGPNARTFCEPQNPGSPCPGLECGCSEDVLAIAFEPGGEATLELGDFEPGLRVDLAVILDARTEGIQGWALGVAHDPSFLTIESATFEGTDAAGFFRNGFQVTQIAREVLCTPDFCEGSVPRRGFVSATVLSLVDNVVLPLGRHSVARAAYSLLPRAAEAGEAGLLIEFRNELMGAGEPVDIVIAAGGETRPPRTVVDGRIFLSPSAKDFHRGDPSGDGRVAIGDAVGLILFLFLLGPSPGCIEAGDADDSGRLDTTDPIIILRWLFLGGSAPAPPGPPPAPCGPDPDAAGGGLGCDEYGAC